MKVCPRPKWLPWAVLLALAGAAVIPGARPLHAQGADTVFVWTQEPIQYDPTYAARNYGCGLWDPRRQRMMVIGGGMTLSHPGAYTYAHANAVERAAAASAWSYLGGYPGPVFQPQLDEACAAMDSAGDGVWLFGGLHNTNNPSNYGWTTQVRDDLWHLDVPTLTWSVVAPTGPAPPSRAGASLSLDAARGRLWLFGGRDTLGHPMNDLWSMDLVSPGSWTSWTPTGPIWPPWPGPRFAHLAVIDPTGDRLIVTGGEEATATDTWSMSLATPGIWLGYGSAPGSPAGRAIGGLDRARGRLVVCVPGEAVIHTLALPTMGWSVHVPFGSPIIDPWSAAILDPVDDRMVVAWAGTAVVSGGAPNTPPTGFFDLGASVPLVQVDATLDSLKCHAGTTQLFWNLQFDHPLWSPVVLESTSTGATGEIGSVLPEIPGQVSIPMYTAPMPGDSVRAHFRWYDGQTTRHTPDVMLRFPPPPLTLNVSPDSIWQTPSFFGTDLLIRFRVPDDSARFLVHQDLERSDQGAPWAYRDQGFPDASGLWPYHEVGVLPFQRYDYRIAWTGPDGARHASAPYGRTILGAPNPLYDQQRVYADSVVLPWSTAPGVDEEGTLLIQRPSAPGVFSDSIPWHTDAAGMITLRDTAVAPDQDYVYVLSWSDGLSRWDTPGISIHTGSLAPPPPTFALGRAQPNPSGEGFDLPLSVPPGAAAQVELFDVAGRRRWGTAVPAGAAGLHVDTVGLESGVYVVRASWSGVTHTTRITVMR